LIEKLEGKGASKSAAYRYKDDAPNRRLIKFRKEKKRIRTQLISKAILSGNKLGKAIPRARPKNFSFVVLIQFSHEVNTAILRTKDRAKP
jgi:hypothetical protein